METNKEMGEIYVRKMVGVVLFLISILLIIISIIISSYNIEADTSLYECNKQLLLNSEKMQQIKKE